eukprot:CAMPEP_0171984400 /NCGR_PEP_ID=MMETSP0993-20121228/273806_1 /TAXON_ID=483369 /ORGANISM="non described non described, Strain CCMP2098" /LENGTH=293 /DNA_ID=CAMNT_0012637217 /DNA_START=462 /DNA_END=1343 /DNA_ORIENTATION=-
MRIFISVLALIPISVYGHPEECVDGLAAPPAFSCTPLAAVKLGAAADYAVLAAAAITKTNGGSIFPSGNQVPGKLGISPGSAVVGFDAFDDAPAAYAGRAGAYDGYNEAAAAHVGPADRNLTKYIAGQAAPYNSSTMYKLEDFILSDRDMGLMSLQPGVYKFAVAAALNGRLILDDSAKETKDKPHVWIFQIGSTVLFAADSEVVFKTQTDANAGYPKSNSAVDQVTWQVGSSATIMGGAKVIGNVLAYASISTLDDVVVNGRLLAKNAAVTIDKTAICSDSAGCSLTAAIAI